MSKALEFVRGTLRFFSTAKRFVHKLIEYRGRWLVASNVYDFTVRDSIGQEYPLAQHKGRVSLVVNVASKCGFTPQYEGLEALYEKYKERGFVILGFPCNQFGAQEPGSDASIQEFCKLTYGVSFPVLSKIEVNGPGTDPLYGYLKSSAPGLLGTEVIKWNFTKFLIGKNGEVLGRYAPTTEPEKIAADIEKALVS
jgi:glutathione peroxidase